MSILGFILVFTFISSIASLIGGLLLLSREKLAHQFSHFLLAFAAGILLGSAFLDLLPEAFEEAGGETNIFLVALIGFLSFFLFERFISWFHHHHEHAGKQSIVPLVILGDGLHNFIDGVVIAATFMIDISLGIVTSLAVFAHEIPQEIGDFAILLHKGVKKKQLIIFNLLSASMAIFGAVATYLIGERVEDFLAVILALTAGFFLYIAASDLVPEIHNEENKKVALIESLLMVVGVIVIGILTTLLEGK